MRTKQDIAKKLPPHNELQVQQQGVYFQDISSFISKNIVARGKGEYYITTSMRKVELMLEFNSFSTSNFRARLVLQVISVPFVV